MNSALHWLRLRFSAFVASRRLRNPLGDVLREQLAGTLAFLFLCALALIPLRLGAATNDLSGLLQKGLFDEEANRNLDAAVQAYQALVTAFDQDRKLAATAVFRLGECYRKLGKTNEAVLQYDRIVREFADEATLATLSRQNLAGLGTGDKASVLPTLTQAARQEQQRLLEQEIKLLEQDLAEAKKRFEMGAGPQGDVRSKEREILQLRRQVAALDVNPNDGAAGAGGPAASQADLLAAQLASVEKLTDDPEKQARAVLALFPDDLLSKMLMNLPKLREQEAVFSTNAQPKLDGFRMAISGERELLDLSVKPPRGLPEAQAEVKKQFTFLTRRTEYILGLQTLRLQGLQAVADASSATSPGKPAAVVVDDEETEILRLQAMIQNIPDLKNAPVGDEKLTPLYQAAGKGQLRVARFLLDNGADLEQRSNGSTPLHRAAWGGHRAMVELLLARGADVNARDPRQIYGSASRNTALHWATDKGFRAVAEALVAGKADLNARNDQQETPLHLAAAKGHVELVKYLISKGAEVDAKDSGGQTPLLIAASRSQSDTVKVLITAKAYPDSKDSGGNTALSYAAGKGRLEMVKALLEAKADPNGGEPSPLLNAVQAGSAATVQALLEAGADVNRSGQIMRALPNSAGMTKLQTLTALALAVLDRKADAAAILLQHKADPNALGPDRYPVILDAVGNTNILKALLKAGARPNVDDGQGRTPLTMAAANGLADSVSLLLAHGADKEARFDGLTPLLCAVRSRDQKSVEALLKAGADVNARDRDEGCTALHLATIKRDAALSALLLTYKAEVNARDNHGLTPLDIANGKEAPRQNQVPAVPGFAPGLPSPNVASVGSTPAPTGSAASLAELLRQNGAQEGSQLPESSKPPEKPFTVFETDPTKARAGGEVLLSGAVGQASLTWPKGRTLCLTEAILKAGKSDSPNLKKVEVVRTDPQTQQKATMVFDVDELLKGDRTGDLLLLDGDFIKVPKRLVNW